MRLLKLLAYGLFGYALFQFVRGMTTNEAAAAPSGGETGNGRRASAIGGGRSPQNITGPGRGEDVETADPDGAAMHHRVGRGVVR